MQKRRRSDPTGPILFVVLLTFAVVLVIAGSAAPVSAPVAEPAPGPALRPTQTAAPVEPSDQPEPKPEPEVDPDPEPEEPILLPGNRREVFGGNRFLVAYYGTAGTGSLGVLGETSPEQMQRRLAVAARPFARPGRPVQPVYELIVSVADPTPGPDGDFSHDIARADVMRYVAAAHRHGALLLLDLQPGRSDFLAVAKRWAWALRYPNVGLALDPEWRMGRREVPGRVIGSVAAPEVNRVSAWLSRLTLAHRLPQKLFVLHQFRTSMIEQIDAVRGRPGLVLVQHVDGFGTPNQKLATYAVVAEPEKFVMGFKLFYDEDVRRMDARAVHRIRPAVRFVSFQ